MPATRLLVTSRRPIGIPGERVVRIDPLGIPAAGADRERILASPAVLLFAARARDYSGFVLDQASLDATGQLCAALDGLPYALELAACKTSALSVHQLLAHAQDRLRLLSSDAPAAPRQQSLYALIDWSYQLLTAAEQQLFRTVSTLGDPWTIEGAQAILPDAEPLALVESLISLTDQSLVSRIDRDGRPNFYMLETLRRFAADRTAALIAS